MKYILLFILILITVPFLGWSEQLSKIAVIDLSEIVSNYFKESTAWRELEEMTRKYEEERVYILEEIEQLESKKIELLNEDEEGEALIIDEEIFKKKEYLKEYTRIKYNQIQKKRDSLIESPTFLSEILGEINYVAENEGYSIVIRTKDPDLMWWSPEVDITDLVLERLRQKSPR
jgi:outer membrane protein